MKVTINVEVENIEEGAKVLAALFDGPAPTKPAAAGKGKSKPAPPPAEEETTDEGDGGFGDDDTTTDDEPTVSLEDCIKALKGYATKHDRPAAMAVLKKFKVKSVQDLDEEHYPALLTALKAKPK